MRNPIAIWLLTGCTMVATMVLIGGITRLTGSGLSIVEWDIIGGTIPPLSQVDWQKKFELYRQFPQYQKVNLHIDLEAFKSIFWWEYIHRLWGRLIGLVFIIPFFVFLIRKQLSGSLVKKLLIIFILGGIEGSLGWIMVKSGLVDQPWVSPYKLTAHLLVAFMIFSLLLWLLLKQLIPITQRKTKQPRLRFGLIALESILVLQLFFGGLMSGLKAGFMFPTFPTMNGQWIPPAILVTKPVILDLFENPATVHFIHRWLAFGLAIGVILFWIKAQKHISSELFHLALQLVTAVLFFQMLLGIATVLHATGVIPIGLAVAHQVGALLLIASFVFLHYAFVYTRSKQVLYTTT